MKIVHIITGLGDGGAEHTLFKICKYDKINRHIVISLKDAGKYYFLLKKINIEVHYLDLRFYSFYKIIFLIKLLKNLKPDIVQTWLVHGDFLGGIAARLAGIRNIIWNIRYSSIKFGKARFATIVIIKILSILSYFIPKKIISVSKNANNLYANIGYDKKKFLFIPNGYNLTDLKIDKTKKKFFKKKNKIKKNVVLIGNVARYDPQKDHYNLLKALSLVRSKKINFFCVLVGHKISKNNNELVSNIKKLRLSMFVKLLGQVDDISEVMNGIDINVLSSSYGEGFPNVLAESMACGTPCITTDIGDSAFLVGKTGWIVSPKNPFELADVIEKAINKKNTSNWNKKCIKARLRVKKNFSLEKMLKNYNKIWLKIYKSNTKNRDL
jgi:glycosyltransferase involved in cell wall biosynthesis